MYFQKVYLLIVYRTIFGVKTIIKFYRYFRLAPQSKLRGDKQTKHFKIKNNKSVNIKLSRLMTCAPSEDSDQPGHPASLSSLRCPHEETLRCGHTSPDSSNGRLTDKKKMRVELHPLLSGGEKRNLSSSSHLQSKYETHKTHNDRTTTEHVQDK